MTGEPGQHELFTIGHSNHELPAFLALLRQHAITAVADVRSQPFSQYTPQFNRETLESVLRNNGILYGFVGHELGARRTEPEAYVDRKARYDRVAKLPLFQAGLDRIRRAVAKHRMALLCAEKDPITCHRTILVCRNLRGPQLSIKHILEDGRIEAMEQAEARLLTLMRLPEASLFQSRAELIEQAYDKQGEKIAYVEGEGERQEMT